MSYQGWKYASAARYSRPRKVLMLVLVLQPAKPIYCTACHDRITVNETHLLSKKISKSVLSWSYKLDYLSSVFVLCTNLQVVKPFCRSGYAASDIKCSTFVCFDFLAKLQSKITDKISCNISCSRFFHQQRVKLWHQRIWFIFPDGLTVSWTNHNTNDTVRTSQWQGQMTRNSPKFQTFLCSADTHHSTSI